MESTNAPQTFSFTNKKVLYAIIAVIVLVIFGLYTLFSSLNRDNKALTKKVVNQTEIVVNQSLLITNLNQKNVELATLLKSYDNKLSILYEKIIEELKKENALLAQNLRQNLKKDGYEFHNKLGEWPKGAEVLMRIAKQNAQKILDEVNKTDESKEEEKPKKVGFWKRIFGSGETE